MPYGEDKTALLASGLGGQRLIIIPEYNIVAVFTVANIYETPSWQSYKEMQKVINAVDKDETY